MSDERRQFLDLVLYSAVEDANSDMELTEVNVSRLIDNGVTWANRHLKSDMQLKAIDRIILAEKVRFELENN